MNCACAADGRKDLCHNRVVQLGVRHRLELFKTQLKGFGVRCRDHIPKGAFICSYSGEMLTDQVADLVSYLTTNPKSIPCLNEK